MTRSENLSKVYSKLDKDKTSNMNTFFHCKGFSLTVLHAVSDFSRGLLVDLPVPCRGRHS